MGIRALLPLLLLLLPLRAEEPRPPRLFFHAPDEASAKAIHGALKRLNSGTRAERKAAREELSAFGPWAVPDLLSLLERRGAGQDPRVRTNAALTLGTIPSPDAAAALRTAPDEKEVPVLAARAFALGALGPGGKEWDTKALLFLGPIANEKTKPRERALLLFAIARFCGPGEGGRTRSPGNAEALLEQAARPDLDAQSAAAALLAAAVVHPRSQAKALGALSDDRDLVRATAALVLVLRPLASDPKPLLDRLKSEKRPEVRAHLVSALAAMRGAATVREELLRIAADENEKKEARIAALLGLASEWGVRENATLLRRVARKDQNDPLVGTAIHALVRTLDPESLRELIQRLRRSSDYVQTFIAGSLLEGLLLGKIPPELEREATDAVASLSARDARLAALVGGARKLADGSPAEAKAELAARDDPAGLGLWRLDAEGRLWALVQRQMLAALRLDDLADFGIGQDQADPAFGGDGGEGKGKGAGGGKRKPDPDEQDLLDFLARRPYFGPEDLVGG